MASRIDAILVKAGALGVGALDEAELRHMLRYARGARTRARRMLEALQAMERRWPDLRRDAELAHEAEQCEMLVERATEVERDMLGLLGER
jgi:hypothetical protein